jgi:hypothetical protein
MAMPVKNRAVLRLADLSHIKNATSGGVPRAKARWYDDADSH